MILRQLHLRRIFFGRVLVRRRPIDALGGDYFHRHPALHFVERARQTRSFTCDALSGVMKSPGLTPASPGKLQAASANNAMPPATTVLRNPTIPNCIRTSVKVLRSFPRPRIKIPASMIFSPTSIRMEAHRSQSSYRTSKICMFRSERHGFMPPEIANLPAVHSPAFIL